MHRASLYKHRKTEHKEYLNTGKIQCLEKNCHFVCNYVKKLVAAVHGITLDTEILTFQNIEGNVNSYIIIIIGARPILEFLIIISVL